jgi:hypothetical protein
MPIATAIRPGARGASGSGRCASAGRQRHLEAEAAIQVCPSSSPLAPARARRRSPHHVVASRPRRPRDRLYGNLADDRRVAMARASVGRRVELGSVPAPRDLRLASCRAGGRCRRGLSTVR